MNDIAATPPRPDGGMSAGRIVLIVVGSIVALIGLGLSIAGGGLLVANATLRDDDGFFTSSTERFASAGYAVATERLEIVGDGLEDLADENLATVRLRVTAEDPTQPVFVGIGPAVAVERYLAGAPHDVIDEIDYSPFEVDYRTRTGTRTPAAPAAQTFWVATASGPGTQTVRWPVAKGRWAVVVMNADASQGVAVDANVGARIRYLTEIGTGLLLAGLFVLGGGIAMIIFGARRRRPAVAHEDDVHAAGILATQVRPIVLEGSLDPGQRRWLWLVKWLLAIPHWIILAFLWLALWVLSVIAFFAILFTGRYPRGIFDFNVGVMRWTWRVSFYGYSALGTDRYPPFTLADDPAYPARFDVAYPARLSRGLVLVKWWLLAIPHLIIVAVFTGGWAGGSPGFWGFGGDDWGWQGYPGLISVLVLIAAIALLFSGRYPRGIFDLVMGLNRWVWRVAPYVGLMRDEYPPFRLDMGEREPAAPTADTPTPP